MKERVCLLESRLESLFNETKQILNNDQATFVEKKLAKKLENALNAIIALKQSRNIKIWGIGSGGGQSDDDIIDYINKEDRFIIKMFLDQKL